MWLKVCGICSVEDALAAAECGAQAIGLNFVPRSPRCLSVGLGAQIATQLRGSVEVIGVVADLGIQAMLSLKEKVGLDTLQLHGRESSDDLVVVQPHAYKALRVATPEDVELADQYEGDRLLVDAKVSGLLGGSGQAFDWSLVVAKGYALRRASRVRGPPAMGTVTFRTTRSFIESSGSRTVWKFVTRLSRPNCACPVPPNSLARDKVSRF